MSVVVAKRFPDRIEIGADHQTTWGGQKIIKDEKASSDGRIPDCKLVKIEDDWIFGLSGYHRDLFFMQRFVQTRHPAGASPGAMTAFYHDYLEYASGQRKGNGSYDDSSFLVVYRDQIYLLNDYNAQPVETYEAIGTGRYVALGVLYMMGEYELDQASGVRPALEAACRLDLYCHEPITVHTVKLKE